MSKAPGQNVTITGAEPDAYNGTFPVVSSTGQSCRVAMDDDPGAYSGGGEIT